MRRSTCCVETSSVLTSDGETWPWIRIHLNARQIRWIRVQIHRSPVELPRSDPDLGLAWGCTGAGAPRGLQNRLRGAAEASRVGSIPIHPRLSRRPQEARRCGELPDGEQQSEGEAETGWYQHQADARDDKRRPSHSRRSVPYQCDTEGDQRACE